MAADSKFFTPVNNSNNSTLCRPPYVDVLGMNRDPKRGYEGVGKTSLINRIAKGAFINTFMGKIEDADRMEARVDKDRVLFFRDNSADDLDRRSCYAIRKMDIVLMCYDVMDRESFELISKNMDRLFKDFSYQKARFVLVATKCDVPEEERQVRKEEGEARVQSLKNIHVDYIETSAKTGEGCNELVNIIAPPSINTIAPQRKSSCTIS